MQNEELLQERALALAAEDYGLAYDFLRKNAPALPGAQTLYFLACLAGGVGQTAQARPLWQTRATRLYTGRVFPPAAICCCDAR